MDLIANSDLQIMWPLVTTIYYLWQELHSHENHVCTEHYSNTQIIWRTLRGRQNRVLPITAVSLWFFLVYPALMTVLQCQLYMYVQFYHQVRAASCVWLFSSVTYLLGRRSYKHAASKRKNIYFIPSRGDNIICLLRRCKNGSK